MNESSRWRRAVAAEIAPIYASYPSVVAVMVGGSSARGHADSFSDMEMGVFWDRPPTDAERHESVARIGADLVYIYPYIPEEEVWCDDYMVGRAALDQPKSGLLVEVVHHTTEFIERTLHSVLEGFNPDELKQNLIAGIMDGIPLYGEAVLQGWTSRAGQYPDGLALAVVNRHAQIDHFWRWQMWLSRGENLMMLYHAYTQVEQKILHTLMGLNHAYYFGFKWLDVVESRLPIRPPDLVDRLRKVYQAEPAEGARVLAALVEETYDLIEQHMPEIDVERLRRIFRYQRPIWDERLPYPSSDVG